MSDSQAGPRPAVLVARRIFSESLERLRDRVDLEVNEDDAPWSRDELLRRLHGKDGLLCTGSERIDADLLAVCPQLRVASNIAVGFDNFDLDAMARAGVLATNAPGVLTETTADFGMALLLAAARRVGEGERFVRAGQWRHWGIDLLLGAEVHGSVLGILGMGRIGQAVARRAHHGFGMQVSYHNRSRLDPATEQACGARYVDFEALLRDADHLMLVLPFSPQNRHIIGAAELARMKPGATLVNLARGGIVDDAALAQALRHGPLAAAGLDVFEGEPDVHPALLDLPNVVLTPHIASATRGTRQGMVNVAIDNLLLALSGQRPPNLLNPSALEARVKP